MILIPESVMRYSLRDFVPLIIIFTIIILFTGVRQYFLGHWDLGAAMSDFMGAFFLVFGTFKVIKWHHFAQAYSTYDILAQRSSIYAYAYPLIEITLGIAYLLRLYPLLTNSITFILMVISSIGVALELFKGHEIMCACLGTVFTIPMTYVTLAEDILMAGMAFGMLLFLLL
jgi:hypothetical protein